MAKKKSTGSLKNGRDSKSKRLGVKKFGGNKTFGGNILIRQKGLKIIPGYNCFLAKDYTIHSKINGLVFYYKKKNKTYVKVI